jgi:UDP-glucose 4-epimerase
LKVLLTGAEGNLGTTLQLQSRGREIQWLGVGRKNWAQIPELLSGVDVVVHAAADILVKAGDAPKDYIRSNLDLTADLLEFLRKSSVKKFVFISSCAVYGDSQVTKESTVPTPISANGVTKLLNEQIIREFCSRTGLPHVSLRLFNTFGGRDRFSIISRLQAACVNAKPFTLFNEGISQRDFIHVQDVADIIIKLLTVKDLPHIVNIGSGKTVRIADLVASVRESFPNLNLLAAKREEAEYSRADIETLNVLIGPQKTISVTDFLGQWSKKQDKSS